MKKLLFPLVFVGYAFLLHAASTLTVSIPLTALESKALTYATATVNQDRTNQAPPLKAFTEAEYAEVLFRNQLQFFADKAVQAERETTIKKYEALSASDKTTVDAVLK